MFLRASIRLGYVDSAIGGLRTITTAEEKFVKNHPDVGYTCAFSELSFDEPKVDWSKWPERNEYVFEINGCDTKKPNTTYQVTARPLLKDQPAFCANQSGVIRREETGSTAACLRSGVTL